MNPDSPKMPREEMETWLTSLLLGELSEGEAAAVRELIKHDPELAKLHDELKSTIQLVREAAVKTNEPTSAVQDQPKLSTERRAKLLAEFKTIKLVEPSPRKQRRIKLAELAAVVAIIGMLAVIGFPSLSNFRSERGYPMKSASAPEEVGFAADIALQAAQADLLKGIQEHSQTNYSGLASGGRESSAFFRTTRSSDQESANLSYYFDGTQSGPAKRPEGLTPTSRFAPIALPRLSSADSPSPLSQDYAITAAPANPGSYGIVATAGRPTPEPQWTDGAERVGQPHSASGPFASRYAGGAVMPPSAAQESIPQLPGPAAGVPVSGTLAGAGDRVEIRGYDLSGRESLQRNAETLDAAFRRHYAPDSGSLKTPGVSVTDGANSGGGGGGAAAGPTLGLHFSEKGDASAAIDETKPASPPSQTRGIAVDGVDKFGESNLASTPTQTPVADSYYRLLSKAELSPGVRATNSSNFTGQNELNEARPDWAGKAVAGNELVLGRTFTNSTDANGPSASVASASQLTQVPQPLMESESLARSEALIPELETPVMEKEEYTRLLRERSNEESRLRELNSQLEVVKGKDSVVAGELSRQIAATQERLRTSQESVEKKLNADKARLEATRPYYDAKRNLEDMIDFQRLLVRKINLEEIDLRLPKSAQVEIIEHATNVTPTEPSLWGRFSGKSAPQASATATIKIERDKPDTGELTELTTSPAKPFNPYDAQFIQTETEVIKSDTVLGNALKVLQTDTHRVAGSQSYQPTAASIASLRQQLELKPVANTSMIEIRANAGAPEEAVRVANAVTEAYQQWRLDKGNELVRAGLKALEERSRVQEENIRKAKVELAQLGQRLGISEADASGLTKGTAADLPIRKPSTNAPIPQPEIQTSENNFSTFSLNVSDVSFKLAAASLEKGQMPDPASVRSEEFINAFDYRDPEPAAGAPIAFAWERARYPFAHNRDLLRFSLKTAAAGRQAGRPLNLVLLLDNSGSMERADRVRIIREALRVLAGQLQPQDKLSVITFARTPRLVADGVAGDKAAEVTEAVSGLTPEGGTNLEEALNLGYQTAARHYVIGGINRVVVLTDGAANLGDVQPESLKQKVEDARKQGIALDAFGIGWEGFNDDLLELLSRNGDGRYGFINSPEEAASEFAGQLAGVLKVAASDVKVQVEFNPRRVTSYRQIGYAKHQLTKEQFRDNMVDAAEIAAQEAGNALYTVEVNPAGDGSLCTVRVRYKIPGTTDYREQAWDVPYTGNAPSLEQCTPAMRLAGSAAAFSEWLVTSPFAGEVSPDRVLSVLRGVPEVFGADSRPKTLESMIRQARSLEGK